MPIYSPTGFLDVTNATLRGSKIVTTSNVGVANLNPLNTFSVGSNLQVEDTGSDVLTVRGNAAAAAITLGVITLAPSYSLEIVSNIGNTVSNTVQFTNATTGFVSASNIEIGTGNLFVNTTTGEVTVGEQLTVDNRADITDLYASNLTVNSALYANAATGRVGINTTSPGDFSLDVHGSANVGILTATDVIVTGNLAVSGDITAIRSTTVNVDDPIIGLANNNTSDPAVLDIGFVMARPSTAEGSNVAIIFDESTDTLEIGYTTGKHTDSTITIDDGALFHTNIHGNVSVSNLNIGQFSVVASYGLDHVTNENNSTGDTIISTNATTGLQTTGNVVVGRDALVSGNVGIGTTNPGALLELSKATGSDTISPTELRLTTTTNAANWNTTNPWARLSFYTDDVTGDAPGVMASVGAVASSVDGGENTRLAFFTAEPHVERMCVDRYGNVGIGTTSPLEKFHLYGSPMIQHETRYSVGASVGWYKIGTWDTNNADGARLKISLLGALGYNAASLARGGETIIYASMNNDLDSGVANMCGSIHAHGDPVISQAKFQQVGADRTKYDIIVYMESYTQHAMSIECTDTTTFTRAWVGASDPGANSATVQAALFTQVINNSGNVGIGTVSPINQMHMFKASIDQLTGLFIEKQNGASGSAQITFGVNASSENPGVAKGGIFFERTHANGRGSLKFCSNVASDSSVVTPIVADTKMVITYDGNVGIGTVSPVAKLHVNGSVNENISSSVRRYFNYLTSLTSDIGGWGGTCILGEGDIMSTGYFVSHSGTLGVSDSRIKKNIADADDAESLETLRLLKPKKYQYKDEINRGQEPVWGFIAQEVRDTLPYATGLRTDVLPNIYELANVSQSNVITFVNFNTSNLESNATTLIRTKGIDGKDHDIHLVEVIDEHTIRVEEDLSMWTGSVDAEGNVITQIETTTLTPEEYEALEDKTGCVANISGYQSANVVISVEEYEALEDKTGYEEVIENYTKTTTTYPGTQLFVYGQEVNDFIFLKKEAIWTVATAALQEVDRQLQAEKAKVATLETQLASVLARLDALENP